MKHGNTFFIAQRINSFADGKKNGVMITVAVISVAISVAVMILSLSITRGFKYDISSKLFAISGNYQIVEISNASLLNGKTISKDQKYVKELSDKPYMDNLSLFALKPAVIKSDGVMKGVLFKGVSGDFDFGKIDKYLIEGSYPDMLNETRQKEVVLSKTLSDALSLSVGDKIEVVFPADELRRDRFTISGIFNTSLTELDNSVMFGDIRDIQRISGWDSSQITGYDLFIKDGYGYDDVTNDIFNTVYTERTAYAQEVIVDTKERYDTLFGWLDLQSVNELVVNIIMITVSAFNILAMILILLMQRTSMIGLFKALGMRDRSIREIFVIRGAFILTKGILYGSVAGVGLGMLQKKFHIVGLDEHSYMLNSVPIHFEWGSIIAIVMLTFAVMIVIQYVSTTIIIKMSPYLLLKYDK